jgi:hypothetical protein
MTFQAHIIDAEALREIAPVALRAYAEAQGWQRVRNVWKAQRGVRSRGRT